MAIFTIIMAIISAIPSIIKIIQMIMDALKGQPKAVQAMYAQEVKGVVSRWRQHRDSYKATGELKDILHRISQTKAA